MASGHPTTSRDIFERQPEDAPMESHANRIPVNEAGFLSRYTRSGFYDVTSLQISGIPVIVGIDYSLRRAIIDTENL